MKKFITGFIIFSITLISFSQQTDRLILNTCSHAKSLRHFNDKEIEANRSPLMDFYDVKFYHLNLNVEDTTTHISGNTTIHASSTVPSLQTFVFELIDEMYIDSILVGGTNYSFIHTADQVFVSLDNPVSQGEIISVDVYYSGTPPSGDFFSGVSIDTSEAWNTSVVWTLSEPFNARQWFPVKQDLNDKADSVWVFLTTSAGNKAGSIGLLTAEVSLPGNKTRYEWKSSYPIAYYLVSFAVAAYTDYSFYAHPAGLQGDSVLIQNFIYATPGCLDHFQKDIDLTDDFLELFSDLYSLYPFHREKYGHCLTELSGGMEHQTMTTIGSFNFGLVSHELAHMWFGNQVTCATWSDIWVNEGFATYSDYLAHEKIAGPPYPAKWLGQAHEFVISQPGGSVYIPPDEISTDNVNRIFDARLSYYKGALLLHMIRFELADDTTFFDVLKNYQQAFCDSVATGLDFLNVLNVTSGKDFTSFFEQWYFGEGFPVYSFNWSQQEDLVTIQSSQSTSMPDVTSFFRQSIPVRLFFNGSDTNVLIHHQQPEVLFTMNLSSTVDSIQIDPDQWMVKEIASVNGINLSATGSIFEVFPNPAGSEITVKTGFSAPYKVNLLSLSGEELLKVSSKEQTVKINVRDLKSGVYLVQVLIREKQYAQKLIKH